MGVAVTDELKLDEVEGVDNGVIVDVTVPEIVADDVCVCVAEGEGLEATLGVIDGEAPFERLSVTFAVIEPDIVEELLGVPVIVFEGDGVPVGVKLELTVEDGLFPADGETVPDCDADSPAERVVVGELEDVGLTLTVVDGVCELVPDCVLVSEPVPEPVGV